MQNFFKVVGVRYEKHQCFSSIPPQQPYRNRPNLAKLVQEGKLDRKEALQGTIEFRQVLGCFYKREDAEKVVVPNEFDKIEIMSFFIPEFEIK